MAHAVEFLCMCFLPSSILCGQELGQVFGPFLHWVIYSLTVEFWEFFVYSGSQPFLRCVIFKYFLPGYNLSFHLLNIFFHRANISNVDEEKFFYHFSFIDCTFDFLSKNSLPNVITCFLTLSLFDYFFGASLTSSCYLTHLIFTMILWGCYYFYITSYYRWGNWGTKSLNHLPKAHLAFDGRAGIWTHTSGPSEPTITRIRLKLCPWTLSLEGYKSKKTGTICSFLSFIS